MQKEHVLKFSIQVFPGRAADKNPTANAGDSFSPWSREVPQATEQLHLNVPSTESTLWSPQATTTAPTRLEPALHNQRRRCNEEPVCCREEQSPLATLEKA